jgi:GT2 family glycosyltransferase
MEAQTERQRSLLESFFSESSLARSLGADFCLDGVSGGASDEASDPAVRALLVPRAEQTRLVFPRVSEPEVSIIIPVHDKFEFTYSCLKSVLDACADISYEVIVADDASADKTAGLSHIVQGVTIVRNETPLLFLRNCNHAAKTAHGRFLVFLNNDTIVKPGWLAAMLGCMKSADDIGVVGSKLLFADGRLQEAGGIIWTDGTGFNFGRGEDPEAAAYRAAREVDYVSGCSLMVRRDLWEALGGFDERFAPAYYEDTDLCFAARRREYRVVYEPGSVLVHFEGISNGRDLSAGVKAYQEKNREAFVEKWRDVLEAEQFAPCTEFEKASDRSKRR